MMFFTSAFNDADTIAINPRNVRSRIGNGDAGRALRFYFLTGRI